MKAIVAGIEHFLVLRPARVQCDKCADIYQCRDYHRWGTAEDRERLTVDLIQAGWKVEGNHERHLCPTCAAGEDS